MKVAAIAFTQSGLALGRRIQRLLTEDQVTLAAATGPDKVSFRHWTEENFPVSDALIFLGAAGIAVRAVAPLLRSKTTDPAVLVLDDRGKFCISLLSGHLGGANDLARRLAAALDAVPVITTATDNHGVFAVDTWAKSQGLAIVNPAGIKGFSARLLAGQPARLWSEFPVTGHIPDGVVLVGARPCDAMVTLRPRGMKDVLYLVPPAACIGVGCRKDISLEALEQALEMLLAKGGIDRRAVCGLYTLDRKANEPALLALAQELGVPLTAYTAAELNAVRGQFTASAFVQKTTGTDNVCERSAVLGSGGGRLIAKKHAEGGVTMALALADVVLRLEEEP